MSGCLAIDFGNYYTTAAYWRQDLGRAEVLYIPGVTRPLSVGVIGRNKKVYAAPSLSSYGKEDAEGALLIGQEAAEIFQDVAADRKVFSNFQADVVSGKRVYSSAGSSRLSGQDIARDFLASVIRRAGQVLGLANEAVIAFTVPAEACRSEAAWGRYRRWLETTTRQAGFNRLEMVEEPWAAAMGAGMPVKPEAVYIVLNVNADIVNAVIVRAAPYNCDETERHIRVLSQSDGWLACADEHNEPTLTITAVIQQALREAELLGYSAGSLSGVVVTGSNLSNAIKDIIYNFFAGIPIYDKQPMAAAACGAAALAAGLDTCGYIRHRYGLRFLADTGYQYRELVAEGIFYPTNEPVAEFVIRASYDGQREFALYIYRLGDKEQCINEEVPLILTTRFPATRGQAVIAVKASIDSAGQLVVTATELGGLTIVADNVPIAKLV